MVTKTIKLAGLAGLMVIIAGCSALGQGNPSVSEEADAPHTSQSAAATAPEELEANTAPEAEANAAPTEAIDLAPAEEAAPAPQAQAETNEVALADQPEASLILPPPKNELKEGEYTWNQLLPRDGIRPVYEPRFAPAGEAPYDDNELVIGVEINGQAKAYAIGPLNGREMVNDTVGGVPILVTW